MDAAEGGVESILSRTPFFALVRCVVARVVAEVVREADQLIRVMVWPGVLVVKCKRKAHTFSAGCAWRAPQQRKRRAAETCPAPPAGVGFNEHRRDRPCS